MFKFEYTKKEFINALKKENHPSFSDEEIDDLNLLSDEDFNSSLFEASLYLRDMNFIYFKNGYISLNDENPGFEATGLSSGKYSYNGIQEHFVYKGVLEIIASIIIFINNEFFMDLDIKRWDEAHQNNTKVVKEVIKETAEEEVEVIEVPVEEVPVDEAC